MEKLLCYYKEIYDMNDAQFAFTLLIIFVSSVILALEFNNILSVCFGVIASVTYVFYILKG